MFIKTFIQFMHFLGIESFVFKGIYHYSENESIEIAIKKRISKQFDEFDVYREIRVLSKCAIMSGVEDRLNHKEDTPFPGRSKHPNIVGFIGFCINEKKEICMLMELLCGKPLSHFYPNKPNKIFSFLRRTFNVMPKKAERLELHSIDQILATARQICAGMEFLSRIGIIHIDLAARNCV